MSVELAGLDYDSLEKMIGSECYETALEYVRRKAVSQQIWIASQNALFGIVNGRHGDHYTPTVYFSRQGPVPAVKAVRCNCAASYGCEHAAALVIAAAAGGGAATGTAALGTVFPASALAGTLSGSRRGSWDASLESWLAAGREAGRTGEATLAIELTLEADQAGRPLVPRLPGQEHGFPGALPVRLMARLVQPGKQGGWVGGSLSWGKLGGYGYYSGPSATQARLLRELVALYRTRVSSPGCYYPGGDERAIELSAIESSRLWPLLDEARQAGLPLVYRRKLGPVEGYREAELGLDVTGDEDGGGLAVTPVIRLDGPGAGPGPGSLAGAGSTDAGTAGPEAAAGARSADVVPVRFIGTQGHGLVYLDGTEAGRNAEPGDWRFRLARLRRAVPEPLQEMALAGQRLVIPTAGLARFCEEFYPRLRQMATMTSSDGAFTPPDISGPTLVLCASYGAEHDVQVDWKWAYQVGDAQLRSDLDASPEDTGYRDTRAELAILDRLALSGVLDGELASRAMAPGTRFRGLDTVRFTTELLPLLSRQPGLAVEITGDPADYREVSDSLCVSVSADAVDGDPDWFDLGITLMAEGRKIPFADVFTALTLGQSHLLLPGGAYFSLDRPELRQLAQLIREARALQDAPGDQLRISRFQAGLWAELAGLGVVERQAQAWQEQVQGLLGLGQVGSSDRLRPPGTLRAELRSYQLEGFQWLAFLWRHRLGGILADDMGLGKTLEALALICHARQADPDGAPFLVVAPTSVVPNWAAEAARFAPGLTVVTITDTLARRGAELSELIAGADLVVTSYTLLRLDFGAHATTGWSGLILDEAQYTKNHLSKIYQCARRLAAPVKIAITGTPMENNLMELWSLLSITAPGLFPEPERFRAFYARPIERQGDAELLARLRRRIRPLIMRRTKEQVAAELPDKQEQVLEVDLAPRHRKIYQTQLQRERQKVLRLLDDGDLNANRFTILSSLTRLRQLSLHAALIGDEHADVPCSKIDTLVGQILDVAAGGHRALVFSQFTRFLGYVRDRLDQAGVRYCYLDGKTRDRAAVLREFKEGTDPVFLISLKAGGFGLNLTEADYCFLLDPWWNPATEAQAVDRTHRIGQTRNVIVYRLIARDTIEEKVMALKARKGELFASVVDEGNVFGGRLDEDDIRGLLA